MGRVSLALRGAIIAIAVSACVAGAAHAQDVAPKPSATKAEKKSQDAKVKSRYRPGSMLVGRRGMPAIPDVRGDFERRRDEELLLHFARRAELDVIGHRARETGDYALLQRVEVVSRMETRRHRAAMKLLAEAALYHAYQGAQ